MLECGILDLCLCWLCKVLVLSWVVGLVIIVLVFGWLCFGFGFVLVCILVFVSMVVVGLLYF